MSASDRPIHVVADPVHAQPGQRSVVFWLVLLRGFLLIPHLLWLWLWSIAAFLALAVNWTVVLFTGRLTPGLHDFSGAFVRCCVHVWAYAACLTDRYPRFDGKPGSYPVDVVIEPPAGQRRWTAALRLVLAVPPLVFSVLIVGPGYLTVPSAALGLGSVAGLLTIGAWCVALVRARPSAGVSELLTWALDYGAQVYGYLALLTDRYPTAQIALEPPARRAESHPVRAHSDDDATRSRLVAFFRFQLVAPHAAWLVLWGLAVVVTTIVNWFVTLVRGTPARPLHRFAAAYVRYTAHVTAFALFATRPFPGFTGELGRYPLEITTPPPQRQHRVVTLLRLVLVLPAAALYSALSTLQSLAVLAAWAVSVLGGRTPSGLRDLAAYTTRYGAQVQAYLLLVTDRYPDSGTTRPEAEPDPSLPPVVPAAWYRAPEALPGITGIRPLSRSGAGTVVE